MSYNIVLKKDGRAIQRGHQTFEEANKIRLDFAEPNFYEVVEVPSENTMTTTDHDDAKIAGTLSAEELAALKDLYNGWWVNKTMIPILIEKGLAWYQSLDKITKILTISTKGLRLMERLEAKNGRK